MREISKVVSQDHLRLREEDERWAGKLAASISMTQVQGHPRKKRKTKHSEYIDSLCHHSGMSAEDKITALEDELAEVTSSNANMMQTIVEKIQEELERDTKETFPKYTSQHLEEQSNCFNTLLKQKTVCNRKVELESLRRQINTVERSIVAESMSKVLQVSPQEDGSIWEVCLESALQKTLQLS